MRKKDLEELTRRLNEFRMSNLNKTFLSSELNKELVQLGFNKGTAGMICNKCFPYEKLGNQRLYSIPKDPIHKGLVVSVYQKNRDYASKSYHSKKETVNNKINEEDALKLLSSKGYQIRKCVGFDLEKFRLENPVLYKKYLKYENV